MGQEQTKPKKKFKEVVSHCGEQFLTIVAGVNMAAAAAIPLTNVPPESMGNAAIGLLAAATLFSLGAKAVNKIKKKKQETSDKPDTKKKKLEKVQDLILAVSFCGVAVAKKFNETTIDKDPVSMDSIEVIAGTAPNIGLDPKTAHFNDFLDKVEDNDNKNNLNGSGPENKNILLGDVVNNQLLGKAIAFTTAVAMLNEKNYDENTKVIDILKNKQTPKVTSLMNKRKLKGACNG